MIKTLSNTNIILCSVLKRVNTYEYHIRPYLTSNELFFGLKNLMVEPRFICVNGIRFKAQFADQFFIDTTLKGKKSLFAVESINGDHIVGDIYLLPSSKNLPVELPETLMQMIKQFVDSDFKLAV